MKSITSIALFLYTIASVYSQEWGFAYQASINGPWFSTDIATEVPLKLIGSDNSDDMYYSRNLDTVYGKFYPWVYSKTYGWVYILKGEEFWDYDESLVYFPEEKRVNAHIIKWGDVEGVWPWHVKPGWYRLEESVLKKSSQDLYYPYFWFQRVYSFKDDAWFEVNLGWLYKKIVLEP